MNAISMDERGTIVPVMHESRYQRHRAQRYIFDAATGSFPLNPFSGAGLPRR